jgi:predicted acylesterase/phospholipase RssA
MRRAAGVFAGLLLTVVPLDAQHALVLSGGGGRGLAHAGAIAALEELGYEMPVIVGTSMGAIIGSLYAAGYDADEIRSIIGDENWLERFAAVPVATGPERDAHRPLLRFGLGTRRVPDGLLTASGVNRRLVELLFDAGVRAGNDFDRLPRRFRAIAADLATGEQVVLGGGDLPRSVRASMAVPGMFAPVLWDERLLVDGGVVNNVPVSVARELTTLPVIAIDVVRPPLDVSERAALDVGVRALRLLIENALPTDVMDADIVVLPRLRSGFTEAWFPADARPLMNAGYEAVYAQVQPAPRRPDTVTAAAAPPPLRVDSLVVSGGDLSLRRLVQRVLAPVAGEYDAQAIVERTSALYFTGLFDAVWPRLEFSADEAVATLVAEVVPVNRTSAAVSARWDDDVGGAAFVSLRHLLSLREPLELRVSARFGELQRRASAEAAVFSVMLPGLAWIGGVHGTQSQLRLFDADTVSDLHAVRRAGGWLGVELRAEWIATLLARADYVRDVELDAGVWTTGPFLRLARLPRPDAVSSAESFFEAESRFGEFGFRRFHARAGAETAVRRVRVAGFVDVADASRGTPRDALPAASRELAPWLLTGALRDVSRATLALDVAVPAVLNGYARARLRAFAAADDLMKLDRPRPWLGGAEIGGAWPTVVGTVELGVARGGSGGGWRLNIGVGPRF